MGVTELLHDATGVACPGRLGNGSLKSICDRQVGKGEAVKSGVQTLNNHNCLCLSGGRFAHVQHQVAIISVGFAKPGGALALGGQ